MLQWSAVTLHSTVFLNHHRLRLLSAPRNVPHSDVSIQSQTSLVPRDFLPHHLAAHLSFSICLSSCNISVWPSLPALSQSFSVKALPSSSSSPSISLSLFIWRALSGPGGESGCLSNLSFSEFYVLCSLRRHLCCLFGGQTKFLMWSIPSLKTFRKSEARWSHQRHWMCSSDGKALSQLFHWLWIAPVTPGLSVCLLLSVCVLVCSLKNKAEQQTADVRSE